MTIRRRLTVSFLAILALFGLNLAIYFWSSQRRNDTVEGLRRAMIRQELVGSIKQDLGDLQKQVALLSQISVEASTAGAAPQEIAQFKGQIGKVTGEIQQLDELSNPENRPKVKAFAKAYGDLGASWLIFYENFGVHHAKAIMELATRAEPRSQEVAAELDELHKAEKARVETARANFYKVVSLTDRLTIIIFVLSAILAVAVAFRLATYLTHALGELQIGAMHIGEGILNYRITVRSRDELGALAQGYNEMAQSLHEARKQLTSANVEMERRREEAERQRQVAESLLLNILPPQVAAELQSKGTVDPKYFEDCTIIFTDFVGFTLATEKLAAEDLVRLLHDYFTAFDQIVARYHLEKLKTIGDSYMCAAGLPVGQRKRRTPSHPVDAVLAALEFVSAVAERDRPDSLVHWAVRVGIHTGPVIAGVVGIQKFAFDIWGDTVNFSSRMESSGAPNRINVSERTHARVKDFFECEYRGRVLTKDKKEVDMYFVNGVLPSLLDDITQSPPPAFWRRYQIYFQKEPPAFPAFLLEPSAVTSSSAPSGDRREPTVRLYGEK